MTREEKLLSLAREFKTDKIDHGYIPYYAKHLPEKISAMLEIGVLKGASAMMFDFFYNRRADIHLIDLFGEEGNMTPRMARNLNWLPHKGDQSSIEFLATIKDQMDVIIDDGSHRSDHQIISFKHLFVNNTAPGGMYVIEDLHCCTSEFYWGGEVDSFEDTALAMFKRFIASKELVNPYFNIGEREVFESLISDVKLYDDKIVFIFKK